MIGELYCIGYRYKILFRDIKSDQIFISGPTAKLAGFGYSSDLDSGRRNSLVIQKLRYNSLVKKISSHKQLVPCNVQWQAIISIQ